jgi:hypothetical protein
MGAGEDRTGKTERRRFAFDQADDRVTGKRANAVFRPVGRSIVDKNNLADRRLTRRRPSRSGLMFSASFKVGMTTEITTVQSRGRKS